MEAAREPHSVVDGLGVFLIMSQQLR